MTTKKIAELENGLNVYEVNIPDNANSIEFFIEDQYDTIDKYTPSIKFYEVAEDEGVAIHQLQKKWIKLQSEIFEQVTNTLKCTEQQIIESVFKAKPDK